MGRKSAVLKVFIRFVIGFVIGLIIVLVLADVWGRILRSVWPTGASGSWGMETLGFASEKDPYMYNHDQYVEQYSAALPLLTVRADEYLQPWWRGDWRMRYGVFVYATLGGLLFVAPSAWRDLRRRHWKRAGCCIDCGYELAGIDMCPECGKRTE